MSEVVYIDDEPMLCRAFQAIFQHRGIAVQVFSDPFEAVTYIGSHPVGLVICDYRMPKLNGLEVRQRIPPQVPFYLVSGELDPPRPDSVPIAGVLQKPFAMTELVELVIRHALAPPPE